MVHVDRHEVLHWRANETSFVYLFLCPTAKKNNDVVPLSCLPEHIVPPKHSSATLVAAPNTLITKVTKLIHSHDELQVALKELQKQTGELKDTVGKKRKHDEGELSSVGAAKPSTALLQLGFVTHRLQQLQHLMGQFGN